MQVKFRYSKLGFFNVCFTIGICLSQFFIEVTGEFKNLFKLNQLKLCQEKYLA